MKRLEDFPEFIAARDRLGELQSQLHATERERENIQAQINAEHSGDRPDPVRDAAQRLLAGDAPSEPRPLRQEYKRLTEQVRIYRAAVNMQSAKVESLRAQISKTICESAEAEYRKIVAVAIDSAVAFAKAFDAARRFRDNLAAPGVLMTLPSFPDHLQRMGAWSNPEAIIHALLKSATESGFKHRHQSPTVSPISEIPAGGYETLACGPEGSRKVRIYPDGKVQTLEWLHQTTEEAVGWSH